MTKLLIVRLASALGITTLALFFVGLIPFLGAEPSAGAGVPTRTPPMSVDRTYKGDRLPLLSEINSAVSRSESNSRTPKEIPFGCDPAFSPISSPHLALVYGRCMS